MRIGDSPYFAPSIRFRDVDWRDDNAVVRAFGHRIRGFYLQPTRELCTNKHSFAGGVMCTVAIDVLARYAYGGSVKKRFSKWLEEAHPIFQEPNPRARHESMGERVFQEFRNGVVHEGRVKNGAQFSFEIDPVLATVGDAVLLNPRVLLEIIEKRAARFIEVLGEDNDQRKKFCELLRKDLKQDLHHPGVINDRPAP